MNLKKYIKIFIGIASCFILLFVSCFFASCSNNSNDTDSESPNEIYYRNLGYHSITFDKYANITSDEEIVSISETKIMVANNTTITVNFNLESNIKFSENNGNFVNFEDGLIFSNFKINSDIHEIENNSIVVKKDLTIETNLNNFVTLGVAINSICDLTPTKISRTGKFDNINTILNNLLYFYANDSSISAFENDNLISSTTINSSTETISNDRFNLIISAEIFNDTSEIFLYLILEDSDKNYYLYKVNTPQTFLDNEITISNLSNSNSKLSSIKLTLSHDITVKDEYL